MKHAFVVVGLSAVVACFSCNSSSDTDKGTGAAGSAGQPQQDAQAQDVLQAPDSSDSGDANPVDALTNIDALSSDVASNPDASESGLPTCRDEKDLRREQLPCDCYGNEANSTTIVDPDCKTQVVCCPSIKNLRCEDHEFISDGGWAMDNIAPCIDETDLSAERLPCNCYGTVVSDVKKDMPDCDAVVKCCPMDHGLKCEAE